MDTQCSVAAAVVVVVGIQKISSSAAADCSVLLPQMVDETKANLWFQIGVGIAFALDDVGKDQKQMGKRFLKRMKE